MKNEAKKGKERKEADFFIANADDKHEARKLCFLVALLSLSHSRAPFYPHCWDKASVLETSTSEEGKKASGCKQRGSSRFQRGARRSKSLACLRSASSLMRPFDRSSPFPSTYLFVRVQEKLRVVQQHFLGVGDLGGASLPAGGDGER